MHKTTKNINFIGNIKKIEKKVHLKKKFYPDTADYFSLFLENLLTYNEFLKHYQGLRVPHTLDKFYIHCISINLISENKNIICQEELDSIKERIKILFKNSFPEEKLVLVNVSYPVVYIIINSDDKLLKASSINNLYKKLFEPLKNCNIKNLYFGVAQGFEVSHIKACYSQAKEALYYRFFQDILKSNIFYYSSNYKKNIISNNNIIEKIIICLKTSNRQDLIKHTNAFFNKLYTKNTTPSYIKEAMESLITDIVEFIKSYPNEKEILSNNLLYKNIPLTFESMNEFKEYTFEILNDILNDESINYYFFENIIKYINENYNKNLKITDIAKIFHIKSSYIGNLFNEKMHTTFNKYLNELRIQKALTFLKNDNDVNLKELSKQVGYTNYFYFTKVFKNTTGYSPSSYKTNNIQ